MEGGSGGSEPMLPMPALARTPMPATGVSCRIACTAGEMGQPDKIVAYVQDSAAKHIEAGMLEDWESDALAIDGWLGDCPQDLITHATAKVLGTERLDKLVAAAQAADDQWALARRAIESGYLEKTGNGKG